VITGEFVMHRSSFIRMILVGGLSLASMAALPALGQTTAVKFLNDWRWEGQSAPLLLANKGYFQKENLIVALTPGTGSAATVAKVASGEFDMGLGDFSALIEHASKNPAVAPPVAVYVLYERTPSALFIRKASGASKPDELAGKKLGAPPFDGGRKLWPAFSVLANTGEVKWENIDAAKREEAFVKGQLDGITGFYFTTMLNIERQGMSGSAYTVYPFHEAGVRVYGNAILVNPKFLSEQPKAVAGFVRAYNAALKAALKDTRAAIKNVKEADASIDENFEWRRARLAFDTFVTTPTVETTGLGAIDMKRVQSNIDMVTSAYKLTTRPLAQAIARTDFLPAAKDRILVP
jgi:NitT/TauT family transport system substrate-binding protein